MRNSFAFYVLILINYLNQFQCVPTQTDDLFNLTVIHNNDFHTRYVPITDKTLAECEDGQYNSTQCVGGVARTVALVKHLRETEKNLLFLNAGDHFQGTFWYTILKSEVVAQFVNLMKHDVMAIGNHEFDDGGTELSSFIDKVTYTDSNLNILSANLNISKESPLYGKVQKSTIKHVDGIPIAIIGYTTPETKFLSQPGDLVTFTDEIEAINDEIANLKQSNPKLNIFIAVGHSGYDRDKEIAQAIPELDLIVGGHSHTFLYSGTDLPSVEKPEGEYPTVVKHQSSLTLIVQAFAYGKYLGKLNMQFDNDGDIVQYEGKPIYLDSTFDQDNNTAKLVSDIDEKLGEDLKVTIGETKVDLIGPQECRQMECNLGNLIADSFASEFEQLLSNKSIVTECNTIFALINGGNIRTSINKGNITYKSIISTLPFNNQLGLLHANGDVLIKIFKHSAYQYRRGGFLQLSNNMKVFYNKTDDQHLVFDKLQVNCNGWKEVDPSVTYTIVMNGFMAHGGDNYTMINATDWNDYMLNDSDVLIEHVESVKDATTEVTGRINIGKSSAHLVMFNVQLGLCLLLYYMYYYKSNNFL